MEALHFLFRFTRFPVLNVIWPGSAKQAKPLAVRFACCGKILFYTELKPLPMISLEFSIMIKAVGSCWQMKLRRRMA